MGPRPIHMTTEPSSYGINRGNSMNYRSFTDLSNAIRNNLYKLHKLNLSLVVGIPRSGMLPANLIALYLNIPMTDIDSFASGKIYSCGERGKTIISKSNNVLVIDDSILSGNALNIAKQKLQHVTGYNLYYGAVIARSSSSHLVDIYFDICDGDRIFEWNMFHHAHILKQSCLDIDGVLCDDPTDAENDDGARYHDFLISAKPKFIPTVKVKTLISCRLEKYRPETMFWLNKHGIQYDNLFLLNLPDKASRIKWGKYSLYKSTEYMKDPYKLFIESSIKEATEIHNLTKKSVFCTDTMTML